MIMANFHVYESTAKAEYYEMSYKNYQFFNLANCMYSTVFACTNAFLITRVYDDNKKVAYMLSSIIFIFQFGAIIMKHFDASV